MFKRYYKKKCIKWFAEKNITLCEEWYLDKTIIFKQGCKEVEINFGNDLWKTINYWKWLYKDKEKFYKKIQSQFNKM